MSATESKTEREEKLARKARAKFFLRIGQAGSAWHDQTTLPLFPLILVMDAEMLESDARYESARGKA